MYSMFAYGMDDTDERRRFVSNPLRKTKACHAHLTCAVKAQHDWRPPGKFEDRIDQLFAPFTEQIGRQVDMVVLHAGCAHSNRV